MRMWSSLVLDEYNTGRVKRGIRTDDDGDDPVAELSG